MTFADWVKRRDDLMNEIYSRREFFARIRNLFTREYVEENEIHFFLNQLAKSTELSPTDKLELLMSARLGDNYSFPIWLIETYGNSFLAEEFMIFLQSLVVAGASKDRLMQHLTITNNLHHTLGCALARFADDATNRVYYALTHLLLNGGVDPIAIVKLHAISTSWDGKTAGMILAYKSHTAIEQLFDQLQDLLSRNIPATMIAKILFTNSENLRTFTMNLSTYQPPRIVHRFMTLLEKMAASDASNKVIASSSSSSSTSILSSLSSTNISANVTMSATSATTSTSSAQADAQQATAANDIPTPPHTNEQQASRRAR